MGKELTNNYFTAQAAKVQNVSLISLHFFMIKIQDEPDQTTRKNILQNHFECTE